jgi:flagellar protein FlaF
LPTEAVIHSGASRYKQASRHSVPARETELAAFSMVNRLLETAGDEPNRIRALGRNHDLWSMLVKDLGLDGNGLPDPLKAQLVSLGLWAMQYSTLAILQKLSVAPLIEVNRNIALGLAAQPVAPVVQAGLHGQEATA